MPEWKSAGTVTVIQKSKYYYYYYRLEAIAMGYSPFPDVGPS